MTLCQAMLFCLACVVACESLMLDRLPRHIPRDNLVQDSEEDDFGDVFDNSVEKKRIVGDPNQINAFIKPTWKAIYPFTQNIRSHQKREASDSQPRQITSESDRRELTNILKDDDSNELGDKPDKKMSKKDTEQTSSRHTKTKRQSSEEETQKEEETEEQEQSPEQKQDFQEWLRREYYRNMAKSFSLRRKRDSGSQRVNHKRSKKSIQPQQAPSSLSEITDNLRIIEDQLFQDALQTMRDGGEDYDEDMRRQNRITNDLSLAYDLETMRNAFFRLRETLSNMENEGPLDEQEMYHTDRKRSRDCPALDQLTSDCSTLSDIMRDSNLKKLLLRACNWHEVCYTCGKAYGLTSEACDGSFIEQTQTICRNDAPCESTASLLVVPLRQRRVFYKRSNPDVCVEESCVENFLKEGLAAMEEGREIIGQA
ncbi:hypothetical protein JTE90_009985 [Oedothorax gibbosus]|uniref:Uncharacterized protein n=1 Tax=Oedothorax gibbosus TaxID=931172 RepID=A0AAV6UDQ8_9ARAC|nr:hypothetical protein JTE90_009985 [Oedothorax gibbosus]